MVLYFTYGRKHSRVQLAAAEGPLKGGDVISRG
jgi:hypothetical protein